MAWTSEQMCKIAVAEEVRDGFYINLGIGMPTMIANYIPKDLTVMFHSENGMLGMGPYPKKHQVDPDLINAGKETISELPYSCYFDNELSFSIVRSGKLDLTVLGALQVSEHGDLANWVIPGKMVKGMGGAMDLVSGVKRVVVFMDHVAKDGSPKLLKECTLPLTGKKVIDRVISNLAIFDFNKHDDNLPTLYAIAKGVTIDEIKAKTAMEFKLAPNVKEF